MMKEKLAWWSKTASSLMGLAVVSFNCRSTDLLFYALITMALIQFWQGKNNFRPTN